MECSSVQHSSYSSDYTEVIQQTRSLTQLLKGFAEDLLQEYLDCQGDPFGQPGFQVPEIPVSGLPAAHISDESWVSLSDTERLHENYTAYSVFPDFLGMVLEHQLELNPFHTGLHSQLESILSHTQGLLSNLRSVMSAMGFLTPEVDLPPLPDLAGNAFMKKIMGYNVCWQYSSWMERSQKDFELLSEKYPC
ncbi:cardiotrophin-2 isoform X2 [Latimeria chalumnae]|uniref:cardiotrophin-2 isoform X2 n=1 Tax=Latimeria chalumnae TaxID=7897 RepID=UPI00313E6397